MARLSLKSLINNFSHIERHIVPSLLILIVIVVGIRLVTILSAPIDSVKSNSPNTTRIKIQDQPVSTSVKINTELAPIITSYEVSLTDSRSQQLTAFLNTAKNQPDTKINNESNAFKAALLKQNIVFDSFRTTLPIVDKTGLIAKNKFDPNADKLIRENILHWAKQWSKQNTDGYFEHYTKDYSSARFTSNTKWRKWLAKRIQRIRGIQVSIEKLEIEMNANNDTATATFIQKYRSPNYSDDTIKLLELIKQEGQWRINKETALQTFKL